MSGGEVPNGFWAALAARLLHPLQLQIIEAMRWIDQPLSVSELVHVFCKEQRMSAIAYHVRRLVVVGALQPTGQRLPARGSVERLYSLGIATE